jgi:hypothetical protein
MLREPPEAEKDPMTVAPARTLDVGPGHDEAVAQVEQWFRDYKETRDPAVRERIILAHLGLADRLALPVLMNGLSELERRAGIIALLPGPQADPDWGRARYSQMHVSRVLRPALAQMREQLAP